MNYKETIDLFITLVRNKHKVAGTPAPRFERKEIMVMLSAAQSEIQSAHKVSMESKQIGYIAGEKTYNLSQDLAVIVE
jgi:hypothetical protein